jgi:hypothetical protein
MDNTAEVPLVGGVADGSLVTVELDSNGRPPLTHHHQGAAGPAGAEIYELESVGEEGARYRYRYRGPTAP